ncbi:hypothetical protein LTR37_002492 [Vermiconidia calcicola]|uniref:Uncharacterized protein n=1 Tax=Vermiconidia calcicola TaxID=1690605 RepID=A0ACC3NSV4_9PEZI|nr:hypothetical protein LTR37_002492 [Vermiconidia calcicola]
MPSSDYSNAVGGGLKLKGAGIEKKKKKKRAKPESTGQARETEEGQESAVQKALADEEADDTKDADIVLKQRESDARVLGKTEAQRRHEERRRKRLDDRLKREGVKTHKERVEELNKYLSTLSEHHDMPRIGPG